MPNLHDSDTASFSIFIFTNLPRALVSFLSVLAVIVNGLKVLVVCESEGYLLTASVTFALPANVLKSGTKRLTAKNTSPANFNPTG